MASTTESKRSGAELDIAYLYSWPLIGNMNNMTVPIERLDFEGEAKLLRDAIDQSRREVRLARAPATLFNLRRLTTQGYKLLHYTGHGKVGYLAFEDEKGSMQALYADMLRDLLSAGDGAEGVQFVFVSACQSELVGKAFVGAGVPHVICVENNAQVADSSAKMFMDQFYLALLLGKTVRQAFNIGAQTVAAAATGIDEKDKFLLLPKNGVHDRQIFANLPYGKRVNEGKELPPSNLLQVPEHFMGRQFEMQAIVSHVKKRRIITITGEPGIGKTALASAAARYIWQRGMFDMVYFIPLGQYRPKEEDDVYNPKKPQKLSSMAMSSGRGSYVHALRLCNSIAEVVGFEMGLDATMRTARDLTIRMQQENKTLLLILDGVDKYLNPALDREVQLYEFLTTLLQRIANVSVILTSNHGIGGVNQAREYIVNLARLPPKQAARLFWHVSPRVIPFSEFNSSKRRAWKDLQQHEVLRLLAGHPKRIINAVDLLNDCKMSDLPAKIRTLLEEEKAEEEKKNKIETEPPVVVPEPPPPDEEIPAVAPGLGPRQTSDFFVPPQQQDDQPAHVSPLGYAQLGHSQEQLLRERIQHDSARHFWRRAFGANYFVPWNVFRQAASDYFLRVTGATGRPLSAKDMHAVKLKLTNIDSDLNRNDMHDREMVCMDTFNIWWPIFDSVVSIVSRERYLWMMDNPEIIHGLMGRGLTAQMLSGHIAGTFILRFSENNPGCIAVGYVDQKGHDQHTLIFVRQEGFAIQLETGELVYQTLEDLIMKCLPLRMLYPGIDKSEIFNQTDTDQPA